MSTVLIVSMSIPSITNALLQKNSSTSLYRRHKTSLPKFLAPLEQPRKAMTKLQGQHALGSRSQSHQLFNPATLSSYSAVEKRYSRGGHSLCEHTPRATNTEAHAAICALSCVYYSFLPVLNVNPQQNFTSRLLARP